MSEKYCKRPNIVFVFSDQHRYQSTEFAETRDPDVISPNMKTMSKESVNFATAISGCPVCSPYRASLLTGRYPSTHGVFVNDVCLNNEATSIAEAFKDGGYDTAYIGKWHLDGHGRSNYIPVERRQGFEYWKVLECTHEYNSSHYYANDDTDKKMWEGYDAKAQTKDAINYIKNHDKENPFVLFLSWGPPHNPYDSAPQKFQDMYDASKLKLRENVPVEHLPITDEISKNNIIEYSENDIREEIAGYYSHITALDYLLGDLMNTLKEKGIEDDTIFIYTSDHGDMMFSHRQFKKQKPYDESIRVPFLMRYPKFFGKQEKQIVTPFEAVDIMPTLLELCGLDIPDTVEGVSFAKYLLGKEKEPKKAALLECIHPFGEWNKFRGGKEYRGIRTKRYTYVIDRKESWLMFDNLEDPYQLNNIINNSEYEVIKKELHELLINILQTRNDEFLDGMKYIQNWGYKVDKDGTVPY